MMLGDVLAQLNDEGEAAEIILGVGDLRLLAAMRERAESEGLDLAAYATGRGTALCRRGIR